MQVPCLSLEEPPCHHSQIDESVPVVHRRQALSTRRCHPFDGVRTLQHSSVNRALLYSTLGDPRGMVYEH